jgi:plastocyanin
MTMQRTVKTLIFQAVAVTAAGLSLSVVAIAVRAEAAPAPPVVHIGNFTFQQASITVKPGTTVTWENDDDIPHTVVATNKAFKSKVLDTGERFTFTFAKAGQFDYFCSLHPHMTGRVIVKA